MKISKTILFTVIALVMLNNVEHLAWVHYAIANKPFPTLQFDWLNKVHSLLVVVIFEIVVITFVRAGQKGFSLFFTFCIWILSMIYYKAPDLFILQHWEDLIAATVYSTIFTISIYMFSEMLAEWYQEQSMVKILSTRINELQAQVKELQSKCSTWEAAALQEQAKFEESHAELVEAHSQIQTLKSEIRRYQILEEKSLKALKCPHCNDFTADSEAQLRSHKGHCPHNPKLKTAS